MNYLCYDGLFLPSNMPHILAANRGFRYGDGLFETMKLFRGSILHKSFHFERMLQGLRLLCMDHEQLNTAEISRNIIELCTRNECLQLARVRLAVFRKEDNSASYIIEATGLNTDTNSFNKRGFDVDLYPYVRKSVDAFANLKTANYLPYVMADLFAREKALDECILLNCENNICDASKANVFLLIGNEVFTPALHQGCVNGVKRRFVIEQLKKMKTVVHQQAISEDLLHTADEVFLTNAIVDLRWVRSYRTRTYVNNFTQRFYESVFSTIYK